MSVVSASEVVQVSLMNKIIPVEIVEICCKCHENSSGYKSEFDCKFNCLFHFVLLG